MILNVVIHGDRQLVARLQTMPAAVHAAILAEVTAIAFELEAYIKTQKLQGQVLRRVTGNLMASIFASVVEQATLIIGRVQSSGDVKYAAIHEFGGKTAAHDIVPKKAAALAFIAGGRQVFAKIVHHPGSVIPERSFMRSALADKRDEIIARLKAAVATGLSRTRTGGGTATP